MQSSILLFLNIGGQEMIFIFVIALFLFGGKKLPELARGLGKGLREFKDASETIKRDINDQINDFEKDVVKTSPQKAITENSVNPDENVSVSPEEDAADLALASSLTSPTRKHAGHKTIPYNPEEYNEDNYNDYGAHDYSTPVTEPIPPATNIEAPGVDENPESLQNSENPGSKLS